MSTTAIRPTDDRAARGGDHHTRVAIIGAGFTGLAMVHALRKAGIEDWLIVERANDVGGVWRSNTYPGIACDVPSHLYSFSFAPNPDWERTFSSGGQIWEYSQKVARDLNIAERTHYGEEVLEARWDAAAAVWHIRTTTLELTADVIVDGSGVLTDPTYPQIKGLDGFKGALFHSGAWDHDHDLTGERVAVIGTGASAIQIVPELQKRVSRLTVFQRTPGWVIPRNDRDITDAERKLLRAVPRLQKLIRGWQFVYRDGVMLKVMHHRGVRKVMQAISKAYMRRTIDDPALRAKLTPDFEIGCKRILITSVWYPALNQPNVDLETSPITEIRDHAVVTADGAEHEVDAIVCATGFHVTDPPIAGRIVGRDGRTLAATWGDSPRAYRGVTTSNFPNLFRIGSIGTGTGHMSQIMQIESGAAYVIDALQTMEARGLASVEVAQDAQDAYARTVHEMAKNTVWATGGCASWYLDPGGEPSAVWPSSAWHYRKWTSRFDIEAYWVTERAAVAAAA